MMFFALSSCTQVTITAPGGIHLCAGPGLCANSIAVARKGQKVHVLRELNGYAEINFESHTGWVCAGSLSTSRGHSNLITALQNGACASYFPCTGCPLTKDGEHTGYQFFPGGRASFREPTGYPGWGKWTVLGDTITVNYTVNRKRACTRACALDPRIFTSPGLVADCQEGCRPLEGDDQTTTRLKENSNGWFQINDESALRLAPLENPYPGGQNARPGLFDE